MLRFCNTSSSSSSSSKRVVKHVSRYSDCSSGSARLKPSGKGLYGNQRGRPRNKTTAADVTTNDFWSSSSPSAVAFSSWSDLSNHNKPDLKALGESGKHVQHVGQSSSSKETMKTNEETIDDDTDDAVQFYESDGNRIEPDMLMRLRKALKRSSINVSYLEQQMLDDEILRLARIAEKSLIPNDAIVLEYYFRYHPKLRRMIQIGKGKDILGNRRPKRVIQSRSFKVPVYFIPHFPLGGHFKRCAQDYESDDSDDSETEDDPEHPEWIETYGCLSETIKLLPRVGDMVVRVGYQAVC